MLGRVIRAEADHLLVSVLGVVSRWQLAAKPAREGDLVRRAGSIVTLVAQNVSPEAIPSQDWWRLHRIASALSERARIEGAVRNWFRDQSFLDVTTPCLAASPGLEVHLVAIPARLRAGDRYLVTSPEYHMKRLLSAGFERIVYHGRAFRDDESGRHHHAEFTMLEWYRAGASPADVMGDVEALIEVATGRTRPWLRLPVREALARYAPDTDSTDAAAVLWALVEHVEPALATLGAVFLTEWPRALASLARLCPHDPAVSERFEAYIDGIELANGFGELTDAVEQRARLEADLAERRRQGLPEYPIDERFLDALAAGLPECTGVALGLDRLVMLAVGARSLDDVVPFPPAIA